MKNNLQLAAFLMVGVLLATYNLGTAVAAGVNPLYIYAQGSLAAAVDPAAIVGQDEPYTLTMGNLVVNNGLLKIDIAGQGNATNTGADISSLSIKQLSSVTPVAPPHAGLLLAKGK